MTQTTNGVQEDGGHIMHNLMMFGETLRKIGLDAVSYTHLRAHET